MNADSILQTHAEVSIAIAGFASVTAALQRPLSRVQRQRFLALLFAALVQVLGSLVPVWLSAQGLPAATVWTWASAVMTVMLVGYLLFLVWVPLRRIGPASFVILNWTVTYISYGLAGVMLVCVLVNLVGLFGPPSFGLYYAVMLGGLSAVFLLFADAVVGEAASADE